MIMASCVARTKRSGSINDLCFLFYLYDYSAPFGFVFFNV